MQIIMQIKDYIKRINKDQFIIKSELVNESEFAITESTPEDFKYKVLTIDFGNNVYRTVALDKLLLVLQEIYGKDYLLDSIKAFKSYDEIKDIKL